MAAPRLVARWLGFAAVSASLVAAPGALGAATVGGRAFHDFNGDGFFNASSEETAPARDRGVAGVTVTAYGPASTVPLDTATTATDGTWTLSTAGEAKVRIEYSGLPAGWSSTAMGTSAKSAVQFAAAGATGLDLGLSRPTDYCQDNPDLVASCFRYGVQTGSAPNAGETVLSRFPASSRGYPFDLGYGNGPSADYVAPSSQATAAQVGSVFGLAWSRATRRLYSSAYVRAQSGLGPAGPGAIYLSDPAAGVNASTYVDLNTVFTGTPAGADPHTGLVNPLSEPKIESILPGSPIDTFRNGTATAQVGKLGLGDLDASEDGSRLFAVNLADRQLYEIPTAGALSDTTIERVAVPLVGTATLPCVAGDVRPFGVGVLGSRVFVGAVCSAESSGVTDATFQNGVTSVTTSLAAYVWEYDQDANDFLPSPVLEIPLDYTRTAAATVLWIRTDSQWEPWQPTLATADVEYGPPAGPKMMNPQPMLSDIAFDANGDMIIGLRDRFADQAPNETANDVDFLDPTKPHGAGVSGGDVLHACASGSSWVLESGGSCAGRGSGIPNNEGPGGGEYYNADRFGASHEEVFLGGLAQVPGFPEVAITSHQAQVFSALTNRVGAGGVRFVDNVTGVYMRGFEIYTASSPGSFANGGGMGGIEALCDAAPIELGNRVWVDIDRDGSQDADEPGLAGVTVELRRSGARVGTAVSAGDGTYRFSSRVTSDADLGDALGAGPQPGLTGYTIEIPAGQAVLAAKTLTGADAGVGASPDANDSDAALSAGVAVVTVPDAQIAPGLNDHTHDIGYQPGYSLGNRVFVDADNSGAISAGDTGRAGVVLELLDAALAPVMAGGEPVTATSDASGYFVFDDLASGTYRVRVAAANFGPTGALAGHLSSTITAGAPDDDADHDDNGADAAVPASTGVASAAITVGPGTGEPLGDLGGGPGHGVTSDDHSNLTLDFGFYPLGTVGDHVWDDLDGDGLQRTGEPGLGGVVVTLLAGGGQVAQATTNASGDYRFDNVPVGTYQLRFARPAGYLASPANIGADDGADSDPDPETLLTAPFAVGPGGRVSALDMGFWRTAAIGDRVWVDLDGNGVQDAGEPGLAGVAVTLLRDGRAPVTTTTDAAGGYGFGGLDPGVYRISVKAPSGYSPTGQDRGGDSEDSDIDASGATAAFTLASGASDTSRDAGLVAPTSISSRLFVDLNSNGLLDKGEPGLANVLVEVFDTVTNELVGDTTSQADGSFLLGSLTPGRSYTVRYSPPAGFKARLGNPWRTITVGGGARLGDLAVIGGRVSDDATRARLVLTVVAPKSARPGSRIAYQYRVTNRGGRKAKDVRLVLGVNRSAVFTERPGRDGRRRSVRLLGPLGPGQTRLVSVYVRVASRPSGPLVGAGVTVAENAGRQKAARTTAIQR